MAINNYFQNYEASGEQRLIEDLIRESIKIYGVATYFLPRTLINQDNLFTEDAISVFNNAYDIEMYVKNSEGFEGEGEFLSRFGIEIRDQITLTMSQSRFSEEVTESESDVLRPREGDLVYLPWIRSANANINGALFQVKFVQHEEVFYQLGKLYTYDIIVERFSYSDERLNTGIDEIDIIERDYSSSYAFEENLLFLENADNVSLLIDNNRTFVSERFLLEQIIREQENVPSNRDESEFFEKQADEFIDFSQINPFSEGEF